MNKNIQELINRANEGLDGVAAGTMPMEDSSFDVFMERFAGLIVQDCIHICEDHGYSASYSYTPARAKLVEGSAHGCAKLIAKKFGLG